MKGTTKRDDALRILHDMHSLDSYVCNSEGD